MTINELVNDVFVDAMWLCVAMVGLAVLFMARINWRFSQMELARKIEARRKAWLANPANRPREEHERWLES